MKKLLSVLILLCFSVTSLMGPNLVYAQSAPPGADPAFGGAGDFRLPAPGAMIHLSPKFNPAVLKGIKVHPDNPFRFDFILYQGDSVIASEAKQSQQEQLKHQATKLIKYFLASLTIPEKDLWVNLSPYEKDRIVPESFGQTQMGRDLLAEDYMLKQITASLIYPEDEIGKRFWKRIYEEAAKKFGTTNIPVNTFNKVWIVPEKAVVYENVKAGTAYVVESRLKVMLEEDYLSMSKHVNVGQVPNINRLGSQIIREIVIPELTREVNEGKNFSQLRQVYNSVILAAWYKKKIIDSILEHIYADKNKTAGIRVTDPQEKQKIYQHYLQAFKKGVYNYIKEEQDPLTQETIPRKYFSGGLGFVPQDLDRAMTFIHTQPLQTFDRAEIVQVNLGVAAPAGLKEDFYRQQEGGDQDTLMESSNPTRNDIKTKNQVIRHNPETSQIGANILRPYIDGLLKSKIEFIVVTSKEAAEQMRQWGFPGLDELLARAVFVESVHYSHLRGEDNYFEKAKKITSNPKLILAIGKGSTSDWGKILGHKFDVDVDIIPSAVSTNAMWTSNVVVRDGDYQTVDYDVFSYIVGAARSVLIDTGFTSLDKRSNIAGAGDLLSGVVALPDWKLAVKYGKERWDETIFNRSNNVLLELFGHAGSISNNTPEGIELSARLGQDISQIMSDFRSGRPKAGSDHILSDAMEVVTGSRHVLHGEQVAVTTLLMAYLYNTKLPGTFDLEDLKQKAISLGLPLRLGKDGIDVTKQEWVKALTIAKPRPGRFSYLDVYGPITEQEAIAAVDAIFSDRAAISDGTDGSDVGGIDLTDANMNLQAQNSNGEIKFHLDPVMLRQLQNAPGFVPVIINIEPLKDLSTFLVSV